MENSMQIDNLVNLLDGYMESGGHHLNVNVLNKPSISSSFHFSKKERQELLWSPVGL